MRRDRTDEIEVTPAMIEAGEAHLYIDAVRYGARQPSSPSETM